MAESKLFVKREGDFRYPICFEEDFSNLAQVMREEGLADRKICIVTDSNVGPLYEAPVKKALSEVSSDISVFTFEAGEKNKNLDTVSSLYQALISNGLDRKSLLVALGGGVVGDLTGFGAATYLRGIDFIQVPTTLLAQVDSSVGGKTGVDFQQYKNMVGAFHQPRLVYMNMSTLSSLPAEQFACGMGEILKTGLICDEEFFRFVCREQKEIKKLDMKRIARMVRKCCEIKAGVVERDPKEQGERALLNLGHTVGHAVEKLKNFTLLHGQCVGAGLVAAAYLSMKRGLLTEEEYQEIRQGCADYDLPVHVDGLIPEEVLLATKKDKKMEQGHIKFILMDGIGKSFIDKTVTREQKEIKKLDMKRIARMVRKCCEIKAGVVERDPKEQGERALLNLGHTVGHAVEKLKNFTLLHGQCVGAGLVAAAYLSMKRGLLTEEEYQEIRQGCADYDLPVHVDGLIPEEVLLATKKDKKMEQGHIKFILMDGIGKSFIDKTVTDEELLSCIQEITL